MTDPNLFSPSRPLSFSVPQRRPADARVIQLLLVVAGDDCFLDVRQAGQLKLQVDILPLFVAVAVVVIAELVVCRARAPFLDNLVSKQR